MIRIVNPLLHTKYIHTQSLRSVFLWWTPQDTFLQFGYWEKSTQGESISYAQIWKYPSFHLAYRRVPIISTPL
jgi:hypothetical protein